jgi:hypothetical protein
MPEKVAMLRFAARRVRFVKFFRDENNRKNN